MAKDAPGAIFKIFVRSEPGLPGPSHLMDWQRTSLPPCWPSPSTLRGIGRRRNATLGDGASD
jgi:hypothetical protein